MEEINHTFESSGPPTTGQYAGMSSSSWFNYDEFMDFADDYGRLDEISVKSRRKIARSAKRTAKRRAKSRKRKERRRKPKSALQKKAKMAAINKVRQKLIKGMKWSDVPFLQREKIDAKVKKKKKRIAMIAKKLMPAMQKAEKVRLARVKEKMTSNDPKKAIESLDIDFENFLLEAEVQSKPQQTQQSKPQQTQQSKPQQTQQTQQTQQPEQPEPPQESKKQKQCPTCIADSPVEVERGSGQIEIILFKQVKDGVHKLVSRSPVSKSMASGISKKDGFVCGTTAQNLGVDCTAVMGKDSPDVSGDLDGDGDVDAVDQEISQSSAQKDIAANKLATVQSNAGIRNQEILDQEEAERIQALADALEVKTYANNVGRIVQVQLPTKANGGSTGAAIVKIKSTGKTRNLSFDASAHSATDIEAAVVFATNRCDELGDAESIIACAGKAGISNADFNKIVASPTLLGAGKRMVDRLDLQLGEDWEAGHSGKGFEGTKVSSMWDDRGASNTTPKTDLFFKNSKTGEVIRASQKIGAGQLMSAGVEESMATIDAIERRITRDNEKYAATPFLAGIVKDMDELKKLVLEGEKRYKLGEGMGPTKWWGKDRDGNPTKIGGAKPAWWDTSGPGKPCTEGKERGQGCGVSWECKPGDDDCIQAKGHAALDHPEWFDNYNEEMTDTLHKMQVHNREIEEKFSSMMESNDLFKRHAIFEALTGCAKFCDCGVYVECCTDGGCKSMAAATHFLTAKKDGTESSLNKIGGINSKLMDEMMKPGVVKINANVKSNQEDTKASPRQGRYSGGRVVRAQQKSMADAMQDMNRPDTISTYKTEGVQTFLEYASDGNNRLVQSMEDIGNDPFKLMRFMEMEVDMSLTHDDLSSTFSGEGEEGKTEIKVGKKTHIIPIMKKEDDYRDYQKEYEEGTSDISSYDESKDVNESFRFLTEPDILDRLVGQLRSKGIDKDKAYAIATSSLQKNNVLKKGSHELTSKGKNRNSMTPGERAKSRAAKKDGGNPSNYNYNAQTNIASLKEELGSNERKLLSKGIKHASGGKAKVTPKNVHKFSSEIQAAGMNVISNQTLGGKDKTSHRNLEKYFKNDGRHQQHRAELSEDLGGWGGDMMTSGNPADSYTSGLRHQEIMNKMEHKKKIVKVKLNPKKKIGWEMHGVGPGGKKTLLKKSEEFVNYEFKDSSIHGMGSFATRDIEEGESVSLYLLSLLNENAPEYQRTDFCRFTNHSKHTPNLIMVENLDGNFFAYANRDVKEGEEFIINYFSVAEQILPLLKEHGQIVAEVLRWTEGYEDIEFPPDTFEDFLSELNYFQEINEGAGDASAAGNPKRAAYLKTYNAQPEQRANRSKRTLARRELINQGRVKVGDGKDVHHKNGNPSDNSPSNLAVKSVNNNRGLDNNKWRKKKGSRLTDEVEDTSYMNINGKFADEL